MDYEKLVRENRFTISVIFPVVGAFMLVASAESKLPEFLAYNPWFILSGIAVMRSPLIVGLAKVIDRRAAIGLIALTSYSYLIELIGIKTGFPYGDFSYTIDLGPMLFGEIPLALPLFFLPLVMNSYLLNILLLRDKAKKFVYRLPAVIGTVLIIDLVLDPAAVAVNFWNYGGGIYYGVPLSNYLGWIISATVTVAILDLTFDFDSLKQRLEECEFLLDDMVSFVIIWTSIAVFYQLWIPAALGIGIAVSLYKVDRFSFPEVKTLFN